MGNARRNGDRAPARATAEQWRAIFQGATLSISACPRCLSAPSVKCRRCKIDLLAAGLAAYHLIMDPGGAQAWPHDADVPSAH